MNVKNNINSVTIQIQQYQASLHRENKSSLSGCGSLFVCLFVYAQLEVNKKYALTNSDNNLCFT